MPNKSSTQSAAREAIRIRAACAAWPASSIASERDVRCAASCTCQAAICTPSDFAFPMNGIAADDIVNTQTVVIADLDPVALDRQRQSASVRPLLDRRHDLCELTAKLPVEHVTAI